MSGGARKFIRQLATDGVTEELCQRVEEERTIDGLPASVDRARNLPRFIITHLGPYIHSMPDKSGHVALVPNLSTDYLKVWRA